MESNELVKIFMNNFLIKINDMKLIESNIFLKLTL
jgi:hypothetical protein